MKKRNGVRVVWHGGLWTTSGRMLEPPVGGVLIVNLAILERESPLVSVTAWRSGRIQHQNKRKHFGRNKSKNVASVLSPLCCTTGLIVQGRVWIMTMKRVENAAYFATAATPPWGFWVMASFYRTPPRTCKKRKIPLSVPYTRALILCYQWLMFLAKPHFRLVE